MPPITIGTHFYDLGDNVARIVRTATSTDVAIWSAAQASWVDFPAAYGAIFGHGGDGHAPEISRDRARAIIGGGGVAPRA